MNRALRGLIIDGTQMMLDTISGKKLITIREGHRDYTNGPVLIAASNYSWVLMKQIVNVRHTTIDELTIQELNDDGFYTKQEAIDCLKQWYPNIGLNSAVTVIRWE
jgi:hypothetical protein